MANMLAIFIILITVDLLAVVAQRIPFICSSDRLYIGNTTHRNNLDSLLSSLSRSINSSSGFYSASNIQNSSPVYATVLCRGDVEFDACQTCVQNVTELLPQLCPYSKQAVLWQDDCMLRYSDEKIVGTLETGGFWPYWRIWNEEPPENPEQFQNVISSLLDDLGSKAIRSGSTMKIAWGNISSPSSENIYALVQCTPDIDPNDCNYCLNNATSYLPGCCYNRTGASVFLANCFLHYKTYPFFNESKLEGLEEAVVAPSPRAQFRNGDDVVKKTGVILPVAVSISVLLVIIIFVSILLIGRRKYKWFKLPKSAGEDSEERNIVQYPRPNSSTEIGLLNKSIEPSSAVPSVQIPSERIGQLETVEESSTLPSTRNPSGPIEQLDGKALKWLSHIKKRQMVSTLLVGTPDICQEYAFSDMRQATKDFSAANWLGTGGFGTVYKGDLHDGKKIAVKRLSEDPRRDKQFGNEISSLVRVRHRNLVKLFGYSISTDGMQKVLVYELVPKGSLNQYIFDQDEKSALNWNQRYKILQGIAGGLHYLHEYLSDKIIHLDLKANNILLDDEMSPKIGDFGLAKLIGYEKSQAITVNNDGTRGYMAPEYVTHGTYSVKSDIFSFGVLLLEIISGKRRNRANELDLVSSAFKSWREGRKEDIVDPFLLSPSMGSPMINVLKCINIGLLCVEFNPTLRPTMLNVLGMFNTWDSISNPSEVSYKYWMDLPYSSQSNKDETKNNISIRDENTGR